MPDSVFMHFFVIHECHRINEFKPKKGKKKETFILISICIIINM